MTAFLVNEELVRQALKQVFDPELGVNVVDLGLIYDIAIEGADVHITMTLTTPGCPLQATLSEAIDAALRTLIPGIGEVSVDLVWDPPWSPERLTPAGREELGWY